MITSIELSGFKSIKHMELKLGKLNVLVGINGAGKSNILSFFEMMNYILTGGLKHYVLKKGGADILLHAGREKMEEIKCDIRFESISAAKLPIVNGYKMILKSTETNELYFSEEKVLFKYADNEDNNDKWLDLYNASFDSKLESSSLQGNKRKTAESTAKLMKKWRFYQFHDTSDTANMKKPSFIENSSYLLRDGGNIAAFLLHLKNAHTSCYEKIITTIKLIAPFFDRFVLEPDAQERVLLKWIDDQGNIMLPNQLSDGTLRLIALITLLLQPNPPDFIGLDEPELGLHPYAIEILASIIKKLTQSGQSQILISTQSATLLDFFSPDDIIVVERKDGSSECARLDKNELEKWVEEFTLGEVWKKNVFGGCP